MSLDMGGFIDDVFVSIPANQITQTGGSYVDGIWVPGSETSTAYVVNIQPVSTRDIDSLNIGADRIVDHRVIYVNDGDFHELKPDGSWEFDANNKGVERYDVVSTDIRVWRNYAKIIVVLEDK